MVEPPPPQHSNLTTEDRLYIFGRFDSKLSDHEGRIRELERKTWDSQQVVSALRWVTIIVGSSLITLFGSFAFDVYIAGG